MTDERTEVERASALWLHAEDEVARLSSQHSQLVEALEQKIEDWAYQAIGFRAAGTGEYNAKADILDENADELRAVLSEVRGESQEGGRA